jgi:hypothetical protein
MAAPMRSISAPRMANIVEAKKVMVCLATPLKKIEQVGKFPSWKKGKGHT